MKFNEEQRRKIESIIMILFIILFISFFYLILTNFSNFITHPCQLCEEKTYDMCSYVTHYAGAPKH